MAEKIAVIGAGVMGLACAYDLLKSGHEVHIYEADDRIGGMAAHFDFKGINVERYYHFICKPDEHLFTLLDELDIKDTLKWRDTYMGYYFKGKLHDWGNPIALLKFPGLDLISKLRYGFHAFFSTKINDWQHLDNQEASVWIKKWIGNKSYDVLWKRLFELKFFEYKDNLSAAWIWTRIKRVGTSRKSMMQEQMGYLEGGSETLLIHMEQAIKKMGGQIHLQQTVQKIESQNIESGINRVSTIVVNGEERNYDAVFSTIPLPFVADMVEALPESYKEKYRAIKNMGVVCVIFQLDKPVSRNFWLNISDENIDIPGLIEFSNLRPFERNVVYVPYYMPQTHSKHEMSDDEFIAEARSYIKQVNPELTDYSFIHAHVSRYGFAQPVCPPGFAKTLPPIKTPIENLFIADTSYYYPEDRSISESVRLGREMAAMLDN